MVHIVGNQQKAQKTQVPSQKGKAENLEEVTLLKASPKSRWKVCKGKNFYAVFFIFFALLVGTVINPASVGFFVTVLQLAPLTAVWFLSCLIWTFIRYRSVLHTLRLPWESPQLGVMPIRGESERHLGLWTRYRVTTTCSNFRPQDRTTEKYTVNEFLHTASFYIVESCKWEHELIYRINLLLVIMQTSLCIALTHRQLLYSLVLLCWILRGGFSGLKIASFLLSKSKTSY